MKTILVMTLACACISAHAERGHGALGAGSNGHSAKQTGRTNVAAYAAGHAMQATASNGNGSKYFEDNYQPWPQEEMKQFQKPHWTPYTGE